MYQGESTVFWLRQPHFPARIQSLVATADCPLAKKMLHLGPSAAKSQSQKRRAAIYTAWYLGATKPILGQLKATFTLQDFLCSTIGLNRENLNIFSLKLYRCVKENLLYSGKGSHLAPTRIDLAVATANWLQVTSQENVSTGVLQYFNQSFPGAKRLALKLAIDV